jgi:hypothetical protein
MASVFKDWQKFVSNKDLTWNFASTANLTEVGLIITGTFYGTREEYDAIMGSATFPGKASKHTIEVKDWLAGVAYWWEEVALLLGGGLPAHMYSKSLTFNGCDLIPDSVIDKMFNFFKSAKKGTLVWFAIFDLAGGFINTIAPDATAYAHRDALYYMQSYAIGGDLFRDVSTETKKFLTDLNHVIESGMREAGEKTDFGAYPGYVDLELKTPQRDYWRYNLPRLELIKTKYDAGDVFRNSQTVKPNGKDGNASQ